MSGKIAVDAQGRIYVADLHRVVRMNDITGNGWTAFGSHGNGNGQFNDIRVFSQLTARGGYTSRITSTTAS